jgi:hypothetical protein
VTLLRRVLRAVRGRRAKVRPQQPHICRACGLPFVRIESSARHGRDLRVVLRCANCRWTAEQVLDEETLARLQEESDRGTEQLVELLELVTGRRTRR